MNPRPVSQCRGARLLVAGCQEKKRKSWRHRLATHGRWSDVVITGLPVRHVARAVQPNVKSSASIFSLKCWEKAGEFSLICKLFLENQSADGFQSFHMLMRAMVHKCTDRGRSHLSINWTLRVKCVWEQYDSSETQNTQSVGGFLSIL